jgi:hypothetical protein
MPMQRPARRHPECGRSVTPERIDYGASSCTGLSAATPRTLEHLFLPNLGRQRHSRWSRQPAARAITDIASLLATRK